MSETRMRVLLISPGFPIEMPFFARGLCDVGVEVIGLGEHPQGALPELAKKSLSGYCQVASLWNEEAAVAEVKRYASRVRIDRVECLWEPGMILAARIREALGLPGMSVAQTIPFRDKERMKQVLDDAGIRTPRHARADSVDACREAAETIGYPLILKPIAGAGSADTHRVDDKADLERVLKLVVHVPELSVEEFIDGEEYTFDTICADGEILFENVSHYRPKPLIARTVQWISPQTMVLRDIDRKDLTAGKKMGRAVLQALDFWTGFTHMEWFLTASGEAVFGEIGARPPGARTVDIMNYACDADLFRAWASAVCHGELSEVIERRFNAAMICKRAAGEGRIQRIDGLARLLAELGEAVVCVDLLPVGAHRRDWKQTLLSDGYLMVRHPDLETIRAIADRVGTDLQLYAG